MNTRYASRLAFTCLVYAVGLSSAPHLLAADKLSLKKTEGLKRAGTSTVGLMSGAGSKTPSLLGQMNLFRGVVVAEADEKPAPQASLSLSVAEKVDPVLKPRFGGLQLSLRDNMSLVYMPGKLSMSAINTESQGLYLLNNQDGFANWFVGMESNAYSNRGDNRKMSTSTQIGVIFNLD